MKMNVTVLMGEPVSTQDNTLLKRLGAAGLTVDRVMPRVRIVTGSIDASNLSSLRTCPGVRRVEETGHFQLSPD